MGDAWSGSRQGDFDRETAYDDGSGRDARSSSRRRARRGCTSSTSTPRATGVPAHRAIIAAIAAAVGEGVRVEVAGGLRDAEAVAEVLEGGAARAVIGTAALAAPSFAGELVTAHGAARIAVAIDVRDGRAVGHGWSEADRGVDAVDAIRRLADQGVQTFEVTAIDRDGLLGGPDLALYERLVALDRGTIIASGGITSAGRPRGGPRRGLWRRDHRSSALRRPPRPRVTAIGASRRGDRRARWRETITAAARQWPPLWPPAASSSCWCASMTFSAMWPGTSS